MKAGITGHRDLGPSRTVSWVRGALGAAIDHFFVTQGVSCLAAGADQLFAELLIERGIPFTAIIPCCGYAKTLRHGHARRHYSSLVRQAAGTVQLAFPLASEQAFYAGGQEVVRSSDLLVAVWNGRPAKGLGGTADVVAFARLCDRRVFQIDPEARVCSELGADGLI